MISFFRKIRQKLLQQNKVARYIIYALGEILLVVIGILIALQVNTWKEENTISKIEQEALINLTEDFLYNDSILFASITRKKEVLSKNLEILHDSFKLFNPTNNFVIQTDLITNLSY